MNVKDDKRVEELIERAKNMCNIGNALLIIRTNSPNNKKGYFDEVYAYLLEEQDIISIKKAYMNEIADTLFMCFDREVIQ